MDKIIIQGGRPLRGKIRISGAKNAALPALFAALLAEGPCRLEGVPDLRDVDTTLKILRHMGAQVRLRLTKSSPLIVAAKGLSNPETPYELVKTMRASVLALGPLLARYQKAKVSLPGGCAIGARPINLHLKALEDMGANIEIEGGYVKAQAKRLHGARIHFDTVTVTGTENIMMAAALAKGETVLENAAREPEVADLAQLLIKMGGHVVGEGTDTIHISGVDNLKGFQHAIIPDRIEMGTYMMAAAITGGNILLENGEAGMVEALASRLKDAGARISQEKGGLRVMGSRPMRSVDVVTAPYPGFATDFQAQFMAMMTLAQDTSVITETIFENRFMHALELVRMGADIKLEGKSAIVKGVKALSGAPVMASDLRASAALVLAGLAAEGITEIHRIYHLDRGYERMEQKLRKLGAKIKRVKVKY